MSYCEFLKERYCPMSAVAMDETLVFDELEFTVSKRNTLLDQVSRPVARKIIESNVALIKTIPREKFPKLVYRLLGYFDLRYSKAEIVEWLKKDCGLTPYRAKLIASDQIAKATELMKVEKWRKRGITKVMWVHSGKGKEPRSYHKARWDGISGKKDGKPNGLNGFIFDIDNPPVIDLVTGERGFPGRLVKCSCYLKIVK